MKFCVNEVEYDLGWGSRVLDTKEFDTLQEANDYIAEFNSQNTCDRVPDWYMVAVLAGDLYG
jgi:hypothetical protein